MDSVEQHPISFFAFSKCLIRSPAATLYLVQLFFGSFAHRNVTTDSRRAHNSFHGIPDGRYGDFGMKLFSVFSYTKGFEMIDDFIAFQTFQRFGNFVPQIDGNEHTHRLSVASLAENPYIRSAPPFQLVMIPSIVLPIIASSEHVTIEASGLSQSSHY